MSLPARSSKVLLLVVHDIVLIAIALWLSLYIRLDNLQQSLPTGQYQLVYIVYTLSVFGSLLLFQTHRVVLRYSGWELSRVIIIACTFGTFLAMFVFYFIDTITPPRSSAVMFPFIATILMYGSRIIILRYLLGFSLFNNLSKLLNPFASAIKTGKKVAIYGAGEAGQQLLSSLQKTPNIDPILFIDDDWALNNALINQVSVAHSSRLGNIIQTFQLEEILLAIPSSSSTQRKRIIDTIQQRHPIAVRTLPSLNELAMGTVNISQLKEVDVADVLGRHAVEPDAALMRNAVKDKVIMITGAGGSIGSEICNQLLPYQPKMLVLIDHSEYSLYQIHRTLESRQEGSRPIPIIPRLACVTNARLMLSLVGECKPDLFFHAAAYKHVPLVEDNAMQGFINNCIGTKICAEACIIQQVPQFVLISTDKAVRPTNLMGATKRIAELILQAFSCQTSCCISDVFGMDRTEVENHCKFSMVRFGNVLESSGSVIPVFREQIKNAKPVTVTHPDITRFFMTIPEAAQLVIQSSQLCNGGDILLLDMGEPIKIADLAEKMITLSGYTIRNEANPDGDINIQFTGLRPGEKLYEELLINQNNAEKTQHSKIWRADEKTMPYETLNNLLIQLETHLQNHEVEVVTELLNCAEIGYNSQLY